MYPWCIPIPILKMVRGLLISLLLIAIVSNIDAIPSRRSVCIYRQADKSSISVMQIGDESFHCLTTLDGYPIAPGDDGYFYFAKLSEGKLIATGIIAKDPEIRSVSEEIQLAELYKGMEEKISETWMSNRTRWKGTNNTLVKSLKKHNVLGKPIQPYVGEQKGLVILVNFANCEMDPQNTWASFDNMFNQKGYSYDNHIGSVHDYFFDQSFGKFNLFFDVVGPITLSEDFGYYGGNISLEGGDRYPGKMVTEACKTIADKVNFNDYDWDGDGEVETVFIVYAGTGEHVTQESSRIWPHKSSLASRATIGDGEGVINLDGVRINTYACACELSGSQGSIRNGIGTACHEFSHCLGLPDLYDTDYSGAFGMNCWDVMDAGSYSGPNGRGEIPIGYSAFERCYVGWMDFEEIAAPMTCVLPPLNDSPKAYILRNDGAENEYFVIENHQASGWFSYTGTYSNMHGMMVTHIDYDPVAWFNNSVNGTKSHQRESIIPADNSYGYYDSANKRYYVTEEEFRGDLFPGLQNATRLSGTSHINTGGKLYNRNKKGTYMMNKTIDNIVEDHEIISFTVGDLLPTLSNVNVTLSATGVLSMSWNPVKDADCYMVEIVKTLSVLPSKTEMIIISDITDTSFQMNDVECKQCAVRVKSKNTYVTSDWSEYFSITPSSGITQVNYDTNLPRDYYDLRGNKIDKPSSKGIYIIKQSGKNYKIYIP